MKELNFFDLQKKKSFTSNNYKLVVKKVNGKDRNFAVAKSPSGKECWRVVSNK